MLTGSWRTGWEGDLSCLGIFNWGVGFGPQPGEGYNEWHYQTDPHLCVSIIAVAVAVAVVVVAAVAVGLAFLAATVRKKPSL